MNSRQTASFFSTNPDAPLLHLSSAILEQLSQRLNFNVDTVKADAAVLVAITNEKEPHILLTRRAEEMRQHGGEVSLPGGKRDSEDKDNIATALREAWEETGLAPELVQLLGNLPNIQAKNGMLVQPIVGIIKPNLALKPQPSEIARIFYMPLRFFIDSDPQVHAVQWGKQRLYFPSIVYDNEIVWGLTARVLVSLLAEGLNHFKDWPFLLDAPPLPVAD